MAAGAGRRAAARRRPSCGSCAAATTTFDALIVGYPGHLDLPAARRVGKRRPVVFNPLVSLPTRSSPIAAAFAPAALPRGPSRDRPARLRAADLVVADTAAHAELFALAGRDGRSRSASSAPRSGCSSPAWAAEAFTALFVGKLIPLHGLETILAAARLAPDLRFRVVGTGQLDSLLDARPPNVEHVPWVEYERLPDELHRAACALGIFGTSAKAARVIPNKAFQALACGTPLVTADTPAARELLRDGESALLVPPGDPQALARAAIRRVDCRRYRRGGLAAYRAQASEAVLGARWRDLIESLL